MECSLYIHVPFCAGSCDYCDFYSVPGFKPDLSAGNYTLVKYVNRVLLDLQDAMRAFHVKSVPTVFIGGGTPSVLGPVLMKELLQGIASLLPRGGSGLEEFTVEANPESCSEAFIAVCKDYGISRISLGVQSFNRASRKAVHRLGEVRELGDRLALVLEAFPSGFSADLIAGLPFQTEKILLDDIEKLVSYKPAHISLYALTIEEGTPLAGQYAKIEAASQAPRLNSPDNIDRLWLAGRDALEKAGYHQYEVSNFCKPGKECKHNLRYWRMKNWLGAGPAASSTIIDDNTGRGVRFTNTPDIEAWLARQSGEPPPRQEEWLDAVTLIKETLLMGFRYIEGPDAKLFKQRFKIGLEDAIPRTLSRWRERGLAEEAPPNPARAGLGKKGILFLDRFLIDAFAEIDAHRVKSTAKQCPRLAN
ncbi:MAG: radical SAM family heme chaperone HemW [Treponema sp.]|jgi:oxygen-independent coproporphyrinogen-3 oxidase|nr:radical SAM family heme chaperone HemW [Treponema sp.]